VFKVSNNYMQIALNEAKKGLGEGGIPIGSVLVENGKIIGRGHNERVQKSDPMAHAEIVCLRNAGRVINYENSTLFSTLMPCYLCAGAVVQFGIKKVVVGESRNFKGAPDFMREQGVEVTILDEKECYDLMAGFIKNNPKLWNEDIGK